MGILLAIVIPALILGALGAIFGYGLAVASKKFAVESDERIDLILAALPGANCGACGYPGCSGYAEAIVNSSAPVNLCPVGKAPVAEKLSKIMGMETVALEPKIACVFCGGGKEETNERFFYQGIGDCRAANLVNGGPKTCEYGCLGNGSCEKACPFDAIHINENRLPVVDPDKCTGCAKCVTACPRGIIALVSPGTRVFVYCHSHAKGPEVRKACKVGCIACGICVKNCPENAITMNDNLAYIDQDKCTQCGICIEKCPTHAIRCSTEEVSKEREQKNKTAS